MSDVRVETVSWNEYSERLSKLRHTIFINEQKVSEELEFDGLDHLETTTHYAVFKQEGIIGTARLLETGQIGRICVSKNERRKGYATQLVRHVMREVLSQPDFLSQAETKSEAGIWLHAQTDAMPLYLALGFIAKGEEFEEADIPHQLMHFDSSNQEALESIFESTVTRLNKTDEFNIHATHMVAAASRDLVIFSEKLNEQIFNKLFCEAVSKLARRSKHTRVRILVQNTQTLVGSRHPLVLLAQRLPSTISIHKLVDAPTSYQEAFIAVDSAQLVFFNDEANLDGFACYRAKPECSKQIELFDQLWQYHSIQDPELRQLSL